MPRRAKPPRLFLRERQGRSPVYVILDRGNETSTGYGPECSEEAEKFLSDYLASKWSTRDLVSPSNMAVADVLTAYAIEHAPSTADPARVGYAIDALMGFWGEKTVAEVKKNNCRKYAEERGVADGTIRRELGVLRAALDYCEHEEYLLKAPVVHLPNKPSGRDRWLTREEVAKLLRVARKNPETRHIAKFILVAVYTGTRKSAILNLGWEKSDFAGHIDIENGILYRAGAKERQTDKERTPARLPRQLLLHARLWRKNNPICVIAYRGEKVKDIKTGWERVCRDAAITDVNRHTLKHTAITWAMQNCATPADAASFFATSIRTIEETYLHHHPDFQDSAVSAMEAKSKKPRK